MTTFAFPGHTRFGFALYITEPQRSIESSPISLVFPSDIVLTAINPKKPLEQSKALALIKSTQLSQQNLAYHMRLYLPNIRDNNRPWHL